MRKVFGQSMVEMALISPILFVLLFGIIDMGWYIYGYATLTQAARTGAEAAAQLPPFEATLASPSLQATDPCYQTIKVEVQQYASMFDLSNSVTVLYPDNSLAIKREVGNPIEVDVTYQLQPLTPLFQLVRWGNNGRFNITAKSVRSIEALGNTPPSEENPNGIVCK